MLHATSDTACTEDEPACDFLLPTLPTDLPKPAVLLEYGKQYPLRIKFGDERIFYWRRHFCEPTTDPVLDAGDGKPTHRPIYCPVCTRQAELTSDPDITFKKDHAVEYVPEEGTDPKTAVGVRSRPCTHSHRGRT